MSHDDAFFCLKKRKFEKLIQDWDFNEPLKYLAKVSKAAQHVAQGVTEHIWSTDATRQVATTIGAEKVARKAIVQSMIALLATAGQLKGDFTKWKNLFQINVVQGTISNVAETKPELFGTHLVETIRKGHPNQVYIIFCP